MIRVLIVARSIVMQAGLEALLATDAIVEVIGRTQTVTAAQVQQLLPDVLLMEEGQSEELLSLLESSAIVLLVEDWQEREISQLLQLGVQGILPSSASSDEILGAIKAAAVGLRVIHPDLLELALAGSPAAPIQSTLTEREIEVLNRMAEGMGNKAIARQLNISEHTVKFHISSIFSKLNVSSRTEAVILGAKQGWLML